MIYLDNAATTRPYRECVEVMNDYHFTQYFNPSAGYREAVKLLREIDGVKADILKLLSSGEMTDGDIIFTSGATEANNHAIKGFLRANKSFGKHFVISAIEHHSVLNVAKKMQDEGFEFTIVKPKSDGRIVPEDVIKALRPDTVLVSIMTANNETGVIQNIEEIVQAVRANSLKHYIAFHTDAVQAIGHIPFDLVKLDVDMFSASAHKFKGPKGVGLLYISNKILLEPVIYGGNQQCGNRAGTLNVPGIMGMNKALELSLRNIRSDFVKVLNLKQLMVENLSKKCNGIHINGSSNLADDKTLPHILSVRFDGVEAERLISLLNHDGIIVGTGAACTSDDNTASHVLKTMGLTTHEARNTVRLSFSSDNTPDEITVASDIIVNRVNFIRKMLNV